MFDHCQCTGCEKCDKRKDNLCFRSLIYIVDQMCEDCHIQAAGPDVSEGQSPITVGRVKGGRGSANTRQTTKVDSLTMQRVILSTTLSEMNRLYGVYCGVTNEETPNTEQAEKAWVNYETYVRRYQTERGLNVTLEPHPST